MLRILGNVSCLSLTFHQGQSLKGGIICFLVNASLSKPLDIATSNFADAFVI